MLRFSISILVNPDEALAPAGLSGILADAVRSAVAAVDGCRDVTVVEHAVDSPAPTPEEVP